MTPKPWKKRPKFQPTLSATPTGDAPELPQTVTILEPMFRALCLGSLRYAQVRKQHSRPAELDASIDAEIARELTEHPVPIPSHPSQEM